MEVIGEGRLKVLYEFSCMTGERMRLSAKAEPGGEVNGSSEQS